ncbi:hypothetical protein T11_276 [Trichinella zimbabwensis]|uniref:Uncharacterized protein n=1 Tax=Trichinella zimbabwensis TaxID=268475 RepID=A0A0V1I3K5_9BILA|nr:hypothetical protein T11_276 [Trichinella zimbabwensis]
MPMKQLFPEIGIQIEFLGQLSLRKILPLKTSINDRNDEHRHIIFMVANVNLKFKMEFFDYLLNANK